MHKLRSSLGDGKIRLQQRSHERRGDQQRNGTHRQIELEDLGPKERSKMTWSKTCCLEASRGNLSGRVEWYLRRYLYTESPTRFGTS